MKQSTRERYNISRWAIERPRLTISFWLAVLVAGIFAFSSLKYALFPDIAFPVVIVNTTAPIESSLETETKLTKPIEASLISLPNADIYSSTYPGHSVVSVAFDAGLNLESSTETVKNALKAISLPKQAHFEVIPFNLNESTAITYTIHSESQSLESLTEIAQDKIIPALANLPGVLKVNLLGDASFRDATDSQTPDGNTPTLVRFNGQDVLAVEVVKRGNANTLDVVSHVTETIQKLQPQLPDVQLILAETQANYIRESIQTTIDELIGAIILTVLSIYPFLRSFRATLINAIAIPLSLLGTFIVMKIAGLNFETLTLLALASVMGIVVDDATVDIENIYRHLEAGETPKQAAINSTREIGLTVSVSTFTLIAVFLPIAFMGGTLGQFFKPFGLTVCASVLISLLVSRTLCPVLAIYWLKSKPQNQVSSTPNLDRKVAAFMNNYRNLLNWSLHHRKTVVGIAIFSFILGVGLIPLIPEGFVPKLDRGEFNIIYTTPLPKLSGKIQLEENKQKTSQSPQDSGSFAWINDLAKSPNRFLLRKTRRVGIQLEETVLKVPEVESAFIIAGERSDPTKGKIYVKLKKDRSLTTSQVQEKIRTILPQLPGVKTSVEDILFVETGDDTPLKLALLGEDLKILNKTAKELKNRVEKIPGLVDVKVTGDKENLEVIEHFNGQRAAYLTANLAKNYPLGDITNKVVAIANSLFPSGITLNLQGDSARMGQIFGEFALTLSFAVICMLLVLVFLFRSLLEPLVIGLSFPLSIVGAMLGLLVTQSDFGMISLVGLIFLLGLLDKNAVLILDYANQLRESGLSRHKALLETGLVRLRPIIITAGNTIIGIFPLALGFGAGNELRQPMAVAIIGGLTTSSLLSLIVVPVLYTLVEDGWIKFRKSVRIK